MPPAKYCFRHRRHRDTLGRTLMFSQEDEHVHAGPKNCPEYKRLCVEKIRARQWSRRETLTKFWPECRGENDLLAEGRRVFSGWEEARDEEAADWRELCHKVTPLCFLLVVAGSMVPEPAVLIWPPYPLSPFLYKTSQVWSGKWQMSNYFFFKKMNALLWRNLASE